MPDPGLHSSELAFNPKQLSCPVIITLSRPNRPAERWQAPQYCERRTCAICEKRRFERVKERLEAKIEKETESGKKKAYTLVIEDDDKETTSKKLERHKAKYQRFPQDDGTAILIIVTDEPDLFDDMVEYDKSLITEEIVNTPEDKKISGNLITVSKKDKKDNSEDSNQDSDRDDDQDWDKEKKVDPDKKLIDWQAGTIRTDLSLNGKDKKEVSGLEREAYFAALEKTNKSSEATFDNLEKKIQQFKYLYEEELKKRQATFQKSGESLLSLVVFYSRKFNVTRDMGVDFSIGSSHAWDVGISSMVEDTHGASSDMIIENNEWTDDFGPFTQDDMPLYE